MKDHLFDHGSPVGPNPGSGESEASTEGTAMSLGGSATGSRAVFAKGLESDRASSCRLVLELLPEAVGGDLDEGTELAITRHVSTCHACGCEWASLRRAHRALTSLSEGSLSGGSLSDGGGTSRMDDAFFAELHHDIMGEVQYRAQLEKDQRVFEKASTLGGALLPEHPSMAFSLDSFTIQWSRFRAPLLHVGSLAAAVLLGILIGNQFDSGTGTPRDDTDHNTAIKVREGAGSGPMREAGDLRSPSVTRIDERTPDEEFRAYLDQILRGLHLPQPVIPNPMLPEHFPGASKGSSRDAQNARKRAAGKQGDDF